MLLIFQPGKKKRPEDLGSLLKSDKVYWKMQSRSTHSKDTRIMGNIEINDVWQVGWVIQYAHRRDKDFRAVLVYIPRSVWSDLVCDEVSSLRALPLIVYRAWACIPGVTRDYYSGSDGWQTPGATVDFLPRCFTLSRSRLAMWHRSTLNSFMSVPSSVSENLCGPQTFLLFLFLFISFFLFFGVSPAHVCVGDRCPPPHLRCLTLEQTWKPKRACQRDAGSSCERDVPSPLTVHCCCFHYKVTLEVLGHTL